MNPNSTPAQSQRSTAPGTDQREHMAKVTEPQTDAAGRSAGLPAQAPQLDRTPTDSPHTPKEASIQSSLRLPHERDQDTAMTDEAQGQPAPLAQAAADLAAGRKDTSRARESDAAYHRLRRPGGPKT